MIKIAHISDIHFRGLQRHDEYRAASEIMFQQIKERGVPLTFIGGDIVHSKVENITPEVIELISWWFTELAKITEVVVMLGNHDGLVHNSQRQDAISPILAALDNPRITLCKDSGVYQSKTYTDVHFCIFSPFDNDEGVWGGVVEQARELPPSAIKIAGFHGVVEGAMIDSGWQLEGGEVRSDFFKPFDYAMLGDIHMYQATDTPKDVSKGRHIYSGSLIQQNFGEAVDKGWVYWEIEDKDTWKHELIAVPNSAPYITLQWSGDAETTASNAAEVTTVHPEARVRLLLPPEHPHTDARTVAALLKSQGHTGAFRTDREKPNASDELHAAIVNEAAKLGGSDDGALSIDLTRHDSYENLYKIWLLAGGTQPYPSADDIVEEEAAQVVEDTIALLRAPVEELFGKSTGASSRNWSIHRVEWDNIFSYGESNFIDFRRDGAEGVSYGIFGPNGIGKSTVVTAIMYALFNSTDRGSMSNGALVNDFRDDCRAEVILSVDGVEYKVTRTTNRRRSKSGSKDTVKTELTIMERQGDLWIDMSGEQRRDTDNILRSLIGTQDDFTTVSLSPQGGALDFVDSGGSARRTSLMRLLDLEPITAVAKAVRDMSNEDRTLYKAQESPGDIRSAIADREKRLEEMHQEFTLASARNKELTSKIEKIQIDVPLDIHEQVASLGRQVESDERALQRAIGQITLLTSRKEDQEKSIESAKEEISGHIEKITRLVFHPTPFEKLSEAKAAAKGKIGELSEIAKEVQDCQRDIDRLERNLASKERLVDNLNSVPCGDSFPTCPFIKDAFVAREEVPQVKSEVQELMSRIDNILKGRELDSITKDIDTLTRAFGGIENEERRMAEAKRIILQTEADLISANQVEADARSRHAQSKEKHAQLVRDSQVDDDGKAKIAELERLKRERDELAAVLNNYISDKSVLEFQNNSSRKTLEITLARERRVAQWTSLLEFLSPKGALQIILKRQIPTINALISKALGPNAPFGVEMDMVEGSKSLDVNLTWGDQARPVEATSGMQKLIASIAIRNALHAVTPLSKSDLFILDEGFGALDADNLEGCFEMLEMYKETYRNIILVSHVEAVKGAVDIPLTVTQDDEGFSFLQYE